MNVLIRAEASEQIGYGHMRRCLTLADGLRSRGVEVNFWSNPNEICRGDLLIVDHYGLDIAWERAQRPYFKRIFVIDDLARNHDCDILLDQNLVSHWKTRYTGKVPENCKLLLGPGYALLPPIYAELHNRIPPREGKIKRVLVSFGGGEHKDLYARVRKQPGVHYDFATPGKFSDLVSLMVKADLAIGACGTSTWERLCLGLPSLVVTAADHQMEIARELNRLELIRWYDPETIEQEIDVNWSKRCSKVVDGRGLNRVLAVLCANQEMPLQIRHANLKDEAWLLELANDPVTRLHSFSGDKIMPETHKTWFHERLRDFERCCFYVLETLDGVLVGQVRFECQEDDRWEINYALASNFRGVGLGRALLEKAIEKLRFEKGPVSVYGHVKPENIASQKIFQSLGLI